MTWPLMVAVLRGQRVPPPPAAPLWVRHELLDDDEATPTIPHDETPTPRCAGSTAAATHTGEGA